MQNKELSGRLLVLRQPLVNRSVPALTEIDENTLLCQRCQMSIAKKIYYLGSNTFYCPHCLFLGRLTNKDYLWAVPEINAFPKQSAPLVWQGKLTTQQQIVAQKLCLAEQNNQDYLVWAVTGSGKTEMLFLVLEQAIKKQKRIALVAPRVDVCTELYPRLQQAFAQVSIQLLHGQGAHDYHYTQLLVCTVHQLLKFRQAFDVLILDECDSYPYANNVLLHRAVEQAVKSTHTIIYLSATPSSEYQQLIHKNKLAYSILNRRFHGKDLPVPHFYLCSKKNKHQLPVKLVSRLQNLVTTKQRFLLFVDRILQAEQISQFLQKKLPQLEQTFVHSKDPKRQQKVAAFRKGQRQALVTTTVLERGVTFKNIDVIVWQADSQRFDSQSLIQIAGRAGRSSEFSDNKVSFYATTYNKAIDQAIKTIKKLNHA
ncbi:DEAD/DEAH box helicase family protein [Bombilactobacillus thymidiniphilus]|uniref:DEAD/DEAH box helicase family protein n=1 Tax=Bombilactobacillus thymidiniphilus TaxID=2923363 RepID=A0ABY4PCF6_9LACO|nr:DEAD/DEAH box helicase family protein [Bombilactobacillus thymidiniphilus]UQS83305.1 DEAD/DEAH box helicase family protein [Bombilactobacillus thymidiniphilus]